MSIEKEKKREFHGHLDERNPHQEIFLEIGSNFCRKKSHDPLYHGITFWEIKNYMYWLFFFSFFSVSDSAECSPGMFRCPEGTCIPPARVCNYQKDCEKGEDELQSSCRKYFFKCFFPEMAKISPRIDC